MIKLLEKSKIKELKAKDQAQSIREGEKVAMRVDELRKLWGKTEKDFEAYRSSTLAEIQGEIDNAIQERDIVTGELRKIKEQYDGLLPEIPLKRKELADFEKKLFAWEKRLEKREEKASLEEIDVAETKKKSQFALARNEDNERTTRNLLIQASKKNQEAQNFLDTAKNIQQRVSEDKKETESALNIREYAIHAKENELSNKELHLMNEEKELEREKVRTADLKATLQRSLDRIKAGRLA